MKSWQGGEVSGYEVGYRAGQGSVVERPLQAGIGEVACQRHIVMIVFVITCLQMQIIQQIVSTWRLHGELSDVDEAFGIVEVARREVGFNAGTEAGIWPLVGEVESIK